MAEVVGALASGAGIASLGCQIFESIYKLQQTLAAIQNAPQELKTILEEIAIVTTILVQYSERPHPLSVSQSQNAAREQAVLYCETACRQLFTLVSEIESGIRESQYRSRWYCFLAVLKAKRIGDLVARLERAKSILALAQLMYLQHWCTREDALFQFRFADWFLRWGISIAICREMESLKITIRTIPIVPASSAIFQACALGDDQTVARLIREGKASVFNMTSQGVTPLHVAAAWHHPSTCKQLLEYGADGSMLLKGHTISWNSLGLAAEYAGRYRTFLFTGLEEYRPGPKECLERKRETMRILTDHNSCEVHQGYSSDKTGYWNGSTSALHMFRGTSEDVLWLSRRENAFMTVGDSDDYIASIVIQQTQMFPNDSFPAAFNQVSKIEHLANYKTSYGSSLLHYLCSSNSGTEPGFWMNGLDIFDFARILLEHGADPTARNNQGNTPLMVAAKRSLIYFLSNGLCWTAESAAEVYSGYLTRWIKTLEACHVDSREYLSREVESGAENFMPCLLFEDSKNGPNGSKHWFVRIVFEQGGMNQELRIKFQFQSEDKKKVMPGTWPSEIVEIDYFIAERISPVPL
ncbi:hypothetical protein OIDMADRAFT_25863 [Oidiodendron maius Zn]|uniref:Fungal N-terminal domain-containing protein n=1 Tax=Oidiodendron maius (strain Zn) TaxID=913774 RepID=A0A0C3D217_OIDMZ|nr:hypothetical protein OIDMADRAFT_25863 [Oidiodendron maius Zn]